MSARSALECQLRDRLHEIASTLERPREVPPVAPQEIPLKRTNETERILYRCAIALKFAQPWQCQAIDLAERIAQRWRSSESDIEIEVVSPGWLQLTPSEGAIAAWLQQWVEMPVLTLPNPDSPGSAFPVQYAHARCCSLLRLGEREGLIRLVPTDRQASWALWQFADPIPWLAGDGHPAERALIAQMADTTDAIACDRGNGDKLARTLSQAFLNFDRHCCIFGKVATNAPEIGRSRLGLTLTVQAILRLLLEAKLSKPAPEEL
jgi:arginyl-tRNA synthetase